MESITNKFQKYKRQFLLKKDKSIKGAKDKGILKVINLINSRENYYTTSSCSGRIVLYEKINDKKNNFNFLFISHDKTDLDDIKDIFNKKYENIWFRQEGFILHVCCKTIKDAEKLLNLIMKIGLKRSGIISLKNKIMVEIIGTEVIDTIIADKKLLVDETYLKILINEANKKMDRNKEKIDRLYEALCRLN